jgi:hypothetical protein
MAAANGHVPKQMKENQEVAGAVPDSSQDEGEKRAKW